MRSETNTDVVLNKIAHWDFSLKREDFTLIRDCKDLNFNELEYTFIAESLQNDIVDAIDNHSVVPLEYLLVWAY